MTNIDQRWPLGAIATILELAYPTGRGSFVIGERKCRLDSLVQAGVIQKVLVVRWGSTEKMISFMEMAASQLPFIELVNRWKAGL
jgi:hypothetical protein